MTRTELAAIWPPTGSDLVAFAWFVWERGYTGKPEIDCISWN